MLDKDSSPRGRGKRAGPLLAGHAVRLIPAWAGKTRSTPTDPWSCQAHPRAGGENYERKTGQPITAGSSPRGRGKPPWVRLIPSRNGLIPARAGKTSTTRVEHFQHTAHPRAGGENAPSTAYPSHSPGSSPRGRGKRAASRRSHHQYRLIPARAGKTSTPTTPVRSCSAHPRAGGENGPNQPGNCFSAGSSPRGRGKLVEGRLQVLRHRLIPARAGKTSDPAYGRALSMGSSPRGRGKHFLTCAFIERIGQILETLELAVSSGSYSLCDVYATDAPQDQARNTGLALPSSRAAS